jgi:CheY-like chemotaxis protein
MPLVADRGQLEHVLMELAAHGREAMSQGGILEIRTRLEEAAPEQTQPHAPTATGSCVVISVSDSGVGMSPEARERLFEPFFTTKKGTEGGGLGLATVYGTIRQSGGLVRVSSEEGRGTRFDIHLPLAAGSADDLQGGRPPDVVTILLVEDYDRVREFARRVLERLGYRVLAAASGGDALDICRAHTGALDLLVTDVMMSGMSGPELAEQVTALRPGISVLYMSGYAAEMLNDRRVGRDGAGFIGKPFTSADLALKVREVLARASAQS